MSHDPSEIILICRVAALETFLLIINVEIVVLLIIFVESDFFSGFFDNQKVKQKQHILKTFTMFYSVLTE